VGRGRRLRLLLDTHAVLWSFSGVSRLSEQAREAIRNFGNEVFVSAASVWEISTKFRIGKLPEAEPLVYSFEASFRKVRFNELPISTRHAQRAGLLPGEHKDPFDRLLIAQAQMEDLLLVSNEVLFDNYGVQRLW
jgi:PIN domain nuclease of toxin-antitoxin system